MKYQDGEKELFKGIADKLIFKTFRKGSVTLTITNQRVIVGSLILQKEYPMEDIVSVERFKAMFMNIGIRFNMKDGSKCELATRHIKKCVEVLQQLGKM